MAALNFAMGADQIIFLVTQKDILKDIPSADDVYSIGTVCRIRQQLRQPNGSSARIMVEGLYRGRILDVVSESPSFYVDVERHTSDGRMDMVVQTNDYIYIFEFKIDQSAEIALAQIEERQYAKPFAMDDRKLYRIGVNFSSATRGITEWKVVG